MSHWTGQTQHEHLQCPVLTCTIWHSTITINCKFQSYKVWQIYFSTWQLEEITLWQKMLMKLSNIIFNCCNSLFYNLSSSAQERRFFTRESEGIRLLFRIVSCFIQICADMRWEVTRTGIWKTCIFLSISQTVLLYFLQVPIMIVFQVSSTSVVHLSLLFTIITLLSIS